MQTLHCRVPLFVRPSATLAGEFLLETVSGCRVCDQGVDTAQLGGLQCGDVTVAAVFAQQCQCVPERQMRVGRPR